MSEYDIDYDVVTEQHTPVDMRWPVRRGWLRVLVAGIKGVWEQFMAYRAVRLYELGHNSQLCRMEGALNDVFDPVDRGIYIDDGPHMDAVWVALDIEEDEVWVALDSEGPDEEPVWVPLDSETTMMGYQFIVYYPEGLVFDMLRMRALVDKYRLAGKWNYGIVEDV